VPSSVLRLTSPPVHHLRVTSSALPGLADEQRRSLSYLTANFSLPGVSSVSLSSHLQLFLSPSSGGIVIGRAFVSLVRSFDMLVYSYLSFLEK